MIELVYLNKSLSKKEADDLYAQGLAVRKGLHDQLITNMEMLETDKQKVEYLSLCLPFLSFI